MEQMVIYLLMVQKFKAKDSEIVVPALCFYGMKRENANKDQVDRSKYL